MAMFYRNNQLIGVTGQSCKNVIVKTKDGKVFKGVCGEDKSYKIDKSIKSEIDELKARVKDLEVLLGYK